MTETLANIFFSNGNWNIILLIIGICSVLSCAIFIERILFLNKSQLDTNQFIIRLRHTIKNGNIVEAIQICEELGGCIANVIQAGLSKHTKGKEQIESAMQRRGMIEIAELERNAKILSIIAYITPLIGLLGTVIGFIQAFSEMRMSNLVDISATNLGAAMEYALVTTAAGLVVAIPTVIAYNYIVHRIEQFILEIQTTSSEVVDLLIDSSLVDQSYAF
ncbi:MAG: biopolymer transporter ExbB [Chlamydia sp. 32-24]|nr:MAG: biopolymer transporter ExbB [Chlamydia sp. 32-24]